MARHHLVIGAGGLLGRAIVARLGETSQATLKISGLDWGNHDAVRAGLTIGVSQILTHASHDPWVVHWCAGRATVRSSEQESVHEIGLLRQLLSVLESMMTPEQLGRGSLTFASSAGGVYAESVNPPFTELSEPRPNSPYGRAKLASERLLTDWCTSHDVRLTVGRIASMYGANQDLTKPQGLLSHLVRAALLREPLTLFVPLSTTRNYISVGDAAAVLLAHAKRDFEGIRIVNVCASENTSIASLLHTCELIVRRRIPIRQAITRASLAETRDLRVGSIYADIAESLARTTLHVGLHQLVLSAARMVSMSAIAQHDAPGTGEVSGLPNRRVQGQL